MHMTQHAFSTGIRMRKKPGMGSCCPLTKGLIDDQVLVFGKKKKKREILHINIISSGVVENQAVMQYLNLT